MSLRRCVAWISAGLCVGVVTFALVAPALTSAQREPDADRREIEALRTRLKENEAREIEEVAIEAESNPKPVAALALVRVVRAGTHRAEARVGERPAEIRAGLDQIVRRAERRVLSEGLAATCTRATGSDWAATSKAAREALAELNHPSLEEGRAFESAEFRARLTEARKLLDQMQKHARTLSALAGLTAALGELDGKPADEVAILGKVERDSLPGTLALRVDYLRAWAEVRGSTATRWKKPPDVNAIQASVQRLEDSLGKISKNDRHLGKELLMDLAVKALLEGYPESALALLKEAPSEHAAKLLSDLRSLALGEGMVESWPARAVVDDRSSRPPRGLQPIMPQAAREGWRPPVMAKADLGSVERAEKLAQKVKSQMAKAMTAEKAAAETKAAQTAKALTTLRQQALAPEQAERKKLVAVEAELDRRLKPAERVRARTMLAEKKTPRQIAAALSQAADAEDEAASFLAEVERRLGRPLGREESAQASRLREQGRTSAEVADVLRR